MAQTQIIAPLVSSGIALDSFATSGTGNLREAVTLGDPATDAAVASVGNAAPATTAYGVTVRQAPEPPTVSTALTQVTAKAVKGSAGRVQAIYFTNANAALRYFQLHNKATIPLATEVPLMSFPLPAGAALNPVEIILGTDFFTAAGAAFSIGIGWAISTTFATFTDAATASEHVVQIHYV